MKRILIMAVAATSGMTLFSHFLSSICKEEFLETKLLNQLVFPSDKEVNKNHPAGFLIHYSVGFLFTSLYYRIWKGTNLRPKGSISILLGFLNGIIGMLGWHSFFSLHSNPPDANKRKYYFHLLPAHVLFGLINGLMFRKMRGVKEINCRKVS